MTDDDKEVRAPGLGRSTPTSNRGGSARPPADDDPIAELIRIVKAENPFGDLTGERRPSPPPASPAPTRPSRFAPPPPAATPRARLAPLPVSGPAPDFSVRPATPRAEPALRPPAPRAEQPAPRPPASSTTPPTTPPTTPMEAPKAAPTGVDVPLRRRPLPLDPIDLDQALRDFRDAPEEDLRQDSAPAEERFDPAPATPAPDRAETYPDPGQEPAYAGFEEGQYPSYEPGGDDAELPFESERLDRYGEYVEPPRPRRRRGTFLAVGMMMGLLVLGGAVAYLYKQGVRTGGADGDTPIIRADSQPAKIVPDDPGGATIPNQERLVYNRVSGETTEPEAKIVSREEQVGGPPSAPAKEEARFPGSGQGAGRAQSNSLAPLASAPRQTNGIAPVPRKVKTVVVRPDGSIVTVEPQSPPAGAASPFGATPNPAVPTPPSRPQSAPVRVATSNNADVAPVQPVRGAPRVISPQSVPRQRQTVETTPQTVARATPTQTQTQASTSSPSAAATASAGPSEYVVQIAARRNEQQALEAYNALKSQYGGLISRYQPLIQRADLGPSGIYYRVRVGPMASAATAEQLCSQLKAAGLPDCLVRPR